MLDRIKYLAGIDNVDIDKANEQLHESIDRENDFDYSDQSEEDNFELDPNYPEDQEDEDEMPEDADGMISISFADYEIELPFEDAKELFDQVDSLSTLSQEIDSIATASEQEDALDGQMDDEEFDDEDEYEAVVGTKESVKESHNVQKADQMVEYLSTQGADVSRSKNGNVIFDINEQTYAFSCRSNTLWKATKDGELEEVDQFSEQDDLPKQVYNTASRALNEESSGMGSNPGIKNILKYAKKKKKQPFRQDKSNPGKSTDYNKEIQGRAYPDGNLDDSWSQRSEKPGVMKGTNEQPPKSNTNMNQSKGYVEKGGVKQKNYGSKSLSRNKTNELTTASKQNTKPGKKGGYVEKGGVKQSNNKSTSSSSNASNRLTSIGKENTQKGMKKGYQESVKEDDRSKKGEDAPVNWHDAYMAGVTTARQVHGSVDTTKLDNILTNAKKHKPESTEEAIELVQNMIRHGHDEENEERVNYDDQDHNVIDDKQDVKEEGIGEDNGRLGTAHDAKTTKFAEPKNGEEEDPNRDGTEVPEQDEIPNQVMQDLESCIEDAENQAKEYDQLRGDDGHRGKGEFYEKVADAGRTIKEYLEQGNHAMAKHYITTLMNTMQHALPDSLWLYLARGELSPGNVLKDYFTAVKDQQ